MLPQSLFEFGDFHFDPGVPLLTRSSRLVDVAPKALEILAVLVKNAGHVVSKDDLLTLVWPVTMVEEGNLAVHISCLRKVFGESEKGAAYIETIPKRGYRFAAPVRQVPALSTSNATNDVSGLFRLAGHYLYQQTPDGCRRAAALYRECMENDPLSVLPRVGLANSLFYQYLLGYQSRDETVPAASVLLAEAKEIGPACPHVHLSFSFWQSGCEWQWERAAEESWYAVELSTDAETQQVTRAWLAGF